LPGLRRRSSEAALLAAVLPNPLRLRVDRPSRYVLARRDWILARCAAWAARVPARAGERAAHGALKASAALRSRPPRLFRTMSRGILLR